MQLWTNSTLPIFGAVLVVGSILLIFCWALDELAERLLKRLHRKRDEDARLAVTRRFV